MKESNTFISWGGGVGYLQAAKCVLSEQFIDSPEQY